MKFRPTHLWTNKMKKKMIAKSDVALFVSCTDMQELREIWGRGMMNMQKQV